MIALPWLIVGLAPLVAWLISFGLRRSWQVILEAIKHGLGGRSILRTIADPFHLFSQPAVHRGEDTLGRDALAAEPTTTGFVAGLGGMIEYNAFTITYLAAGTLSALAGMTAHTIPRAVTVRTKTTREHAETANAKAKQAAKSAAGAAAGALIGTRIAVRAKGEAKVAHNAALAAAAAGAIARPWDLPRVRAKEAEAAVNRALPKWLRRIAAGLAAAIGVGFVVKVLVRHLPWYQCSNVKNAARRLCGMDRGLLDSLLADTLLIAGGISLVQFAREVQGVTDETTAAISWFVRELHDVG